jgi:hypothetical protein
VDAPESVDPRKPVERFAAAVIEHVAWRQACPETWLSFNTSDSALRPLGALATIKLDAMCGAANRARPRPGTIES